MFAFIERLIFLLFVVSLIRSVLQFMLRLWQGGGRQAGVPRRPPPQGAAPGTAARGSTLLHQDPVCGTYVAADSSLKRALNGKVVHFCSEACRDRFRG